MTEAPAVPSRVAVLDVGKTNVKLVLHDLARGADLFVRTMPNRVVAEGPYPHFDTKTIEAFFIDGLADLVCRPELVPQAVSVTTHGAAAAVLGPEGLALPVLDYEFDGPDTLAEAYAALRPDFAETCSPRLPGGLNVGAQLFWQSRHFPQAFSAETTIVTYPQYWSWWLTGIAACEPTSLGAHTDLWAPRLGRFSALPKRLGLGGSFAPLRSAFDVLGAVRPALAARLGLPSSLPVTCGIHDSNASLLPHLLAGTPPLSVVSTGTWVIAFAIGGSLDRLDSGRDTLANVDAFGRPTPSARFMGGREFDILVGPRAPAAADPDAGSVERVIARQVMALPTFAPGNGPFPRRRGRWSHDLAGLSAAERHAAASLYVALMTVTCLDLLGAAGPTVVEGPFAGNALFRSALQHLTARPVLPAQGSTGTSAGAARLVLGPGAAKEPPLPDASTAAQPVPRLDEAFDAYAAVWRQAAAA